MGNSPLAASAMPRYTAAMDGMTSCDALYVRRKQLLFRAMRRGFKEVDLIFGTFAAETLPRMSQPELDQFEVLLKAPDQEIYAMLQGEVPPSPAYDNNIFAAMKVFCARKDPTWNV